MKCILWIAFKQRRAIVCGKLTEIAKRLSSNSNSTNQLKSNIWKLVPFHTNFPHFQQGNAGSAFIEILAGNNDQEPSEYTAIMPISMFMNPAESKSNSNRFRVKELSDKLTATIKEKEVKSSLNFP
jgi:hypothetical protein